MRGARVAATMVKVSFIGAGTIGANSIYATLALTDKIDEIAVVDIVEDMAVGRALDLNTASVAFDRKTRVQGGTDYELIRDSDVVVVSAGLPRKPGMTRLDLLNKNVSIIRGICDEVKEKAPDAVFILVTNPVDVLLYVAREDLGFPRERVIGMSSMHDSARLTDIVRDAADDRTVHATILGEHGETMFPVPSLSSPELAELDWDDLETRTRGRAMKIIERVGATAYAPGACTGRMVKAVVEDTQEEIPSCCILEGEYGHSGVATGVPAILGAGGLVKVVEYDLSSEETEKMAITVKTIKGKIGEAAASSGGPEISS